MIDRSLTSFGDRWCCRPVCLSTLSTLSSSPATTRSQRLSDHLDVSAEIDWDTVWRRLLLCISPLFQAAASITDLRIIHHGYIVCWVAWEVEHIKYQAFISTLFEPDYLNTSSQRFFPCFSHYGEAIGRCILRS